MNISYRKQLQSKEWKLKRSEILLLSLLVKKSIIK